MYFRAGEVRDCRTPDNPQGSPGAGGREAPAKGASKGIFRDFTSDRHPVDLCFPLLMGMSGGFGDVWSPWRTLMRGS